MQDASAEAHALLRQGNVLALIRLLNDPSSNELDLSLHALDHAAMQVLCVALSDPECRIQHLTLAMSESATVFFDRLPFFPNLTHVTLKPSLPGPGAITTPDQWQVQSTALLQGLRNRKTCLGAGLHGMNIPGALHSAEIAWELVNLQVGPPAVVEAEHTVPIPAHEPSSRPFPPPGVVDSKSAPFIPIVVPEFIDRTVPVQPHAIVPTTTKPLPYSAEAVATDLKGTFSYGLLKRLTQAQQRDIVLTGESLSGKAAYYLRDLLFLDKNNFLQTLDLRRCAIAPAGYQNIFFALHQRSHSSKYSLNDLYLSGGALCRESLDDLQAALSQGCVKCLRLSDLDTAATAFLGPLVAQAHREGWKTEIWLNGECLYRGDVKRPFEDHYPGPALPKPPVQTAADELAEALVDKPIFKQERKSKASKALVWPSALLSVAEAKRLTERSKEIDELDLSNCEYFGPGAYAWSKSAFTHVMKALKDRPRAIPMTTLVLNAQSLSDADWKQLASSVKRGDVMRLELRNVGQDRKLLERANGLVTNAQKHSSQTWIDWS